VKSHGKYRYTTRRVLARSLPSDGRENANMNLAKGAQKYYYAGQFSYQFI
jgi:hypothetical protein